MPGAAHAPSIGCAMSGVATEGRYCLNTGRDAPINSWFVAYVRNYVKIQPKLNIVAERGRRHSHSICRSVVYGP